MAQIVLGVLRRERAGNALVSITLLGRCEMASLNARHLGHRGPTDVISFGLSRAANRASDVAIGDIYIAPAVAARNARERRLPARQEIDRLVVHGVLHVLGYDHPEGERRERSPMWRRQEALLRRFAGVRR